MLLKCICGYITKVFLLTFPLIAFSSQSNWENNVIKIHGSNTIGERFAPDLAESFLKSKGFRSSQITHHQLSSPVEKIIEAKDKDRKISMTIQLFAHGSSTGFEDLASQSTHVAMSSRPIRTSEVKQLSAIYPSVHFEGFENIVAYDALAILVHKENNLASISIEQLADVFSGTINNWQQLGGVNAPINVYARDNSSGTYDTFKNLVLKKHNSELVKNAKRFESSLELSDKVSDDIYGIGFVGVSYIKNNKALAIASVNGSKGITPNKYTIGTEDYPLSRQLFMYYPEDIQKPLAKEFIQFTLSNSGQRLAKNADLISFFPTTGRPSFGNVSLSRPYANLASLGNRLSVNLRLSQGEFDSNSKRDLERVIRFSQQNPKRRIVLAGFWDDPKKSPSSRDASKIWMEAITQKLASFEIEPWVVDGGYLPIENNDIETGKALNRRIEVWVL